MNTLRVEAELTGHGAKLTGYHDELEALSHYVSLMFNGAYQAFSLQRESDSKYEDPRTDYLLGRVEAVKFVMKAIATERRTVL